MKIPETVDFSKIFGTLTKPPKKTEKEIAEEWMRMKYGWRPAPKKKDS